MKCRYLLIIPILLFAGCATTSKKLNYDYIYNEELGEIRESIDRGNLTQAIRDLSMLLELDPKNIKTRLLRAIAYQKKENFKNAIEDYKQILKNDPSEERAHYNLGMIYAFKDKNTKLALGHLDHFLNINPEHPNAFHIAKIMCSLDHPRKELTSEDEQIDDFYAKLRLGSALSVKDINLRKNGILKAIQLNSNHPRSYIELAQIYEMEGKYDLAIENYTKALQISPTLGK
ncbi:tetratricopeptide repeat protein, partial [bacterium]|nr:tetratricopeptide repeat protein [bacterium]